MAVKLELPGDVLTSEMMPLTEYWVRHLRMSGRPQSTITVSVRPVRDYVAAPDPEADLDRRHLVAFLSDLASTVVVPATMGVRFPDLSLSLTRFEGGRLVV